VLPTLTLAASRAAALGRLTRAAVLDVVHRPFVQFARAKGLGEGAILLRHVLPNAAIPIVTVIGLQVGYMLGGAIVVETIFALPGLGRMTLDAVLERNYPVVQSGLLVVGAMFMVVNLVTDLLYGVIDPRLRRRGPAADRRSRWWASPSSPFSRCWPSRRRTRCREAPPRSRALMP
jgi:peptide/nickel transport system permease protein